MTFITENNGVVSTSNSSVLALGIGGSFTGTYEDVSVYSEITILTILNFSAGEKATLSLNFSTDGGTTNVQIKTVTISSSTDSAHTFVVVGKFFQVVLSANLGTSATGAIQTIYHLNKSVGINTTLSSTLSTNNDASLTRSILTGMTSGNQFNNVGVTKLDTFSNAIEVAVRGPTSAFGEVRSVIPTPVVQANTMYDVINPQIWNQQISGAGTITSSGMKYSVTNGLGASDYTNFVTVSECHYQPGQGMLMRFTGLFPSGEILNTRQLIGFGNPGNGYFFGYSGTGAGFGIIFRRNGLTQIMRLTVTTAATAAGTATITLNGVAQTVSLTNAGGNTHFTAYQIATQASYAGWLAQNIGATVEFTAVMAEPRTGVYSYTAGTTGSAATFTTIKTGVSPTDIFIPQTSWNIDKMNGTGPSGSTLIPSNGNVYQISFQWLGFGDIIFYIEDQGSGIFQPVHHIIYANTATTPSLQIPHGPIRYQLENFAVPASSATIAGSSCSAFIDGNLVISGSRFSASNTKTVSGTETAILSLIINQQYNGYRNQTNAKVTSLSVSTAAGADVIIRVYLNANIGGNTTTNFVDWTPINLLYSSVSYDTTASTVSGGTITYQVTNTGAISLLIPDSVLNIIGTKGQILTISGQSLGGGNATTVAVTWIEDK